MTMRYFDAFTSGTAAGSGVQSFFYADPETPAMGRVYYKLSQGGGCRYSLLFSNTVDSTFADGSHSHANLMLDEWEILSLQAGHCRACGTDVSEEPDYWVPVTFAGRGGKKVMPGELFSTDPFAFTCNKGDYMCVQITFSGRTIPCHPESLLPAFVYTDREWLPSKDQPFLSMLGCERQVKTRVAFLGDSITQGIGTPENSYLHLAALLSERLGPDTAVWNLGLGYGRAHDAALDGAWLFKARQNDVVCVCFGVNDLFQLGDAAQLEKDLAYIVRALKKSGSKVLLQTIPPFDYEPDTRLNWERVSAYIREELSQEADAVFDTVPVLGRGPETPHLSKYGPHPDTAGNAAWADAVYGVIERLL